ncbi:hypothetical protein XELAEV_18017167mg [Xenopus laevis]|uniref:Uncharacterized protein n=1 Tax=Xenopus laevis TaxID=8355 RepID=A0A974DAQ7_XENLA|nr:hypothetical protein XELAEV_18017167mg [Xenopus laevis]
MGELCKWVTLVFIFTFHYGLVKTSPKTSSETSTPYCPNTTYNYSIESILKRLDKRRHMLPNNKTRAYNVTETDMVKCNWITFKNELKGDKILSDLLCLEKHCPILKHPPHPKNSSCVEHTNRGFFVIEFKKFLTTRNRRLCEG